MNTLNKVLIIIVLAIPSIARAGDGLDTYTNTYKGQCHEFAANGERFKCSSKMVLKTFWSYPTNSFKAENQGFAIETALMHNKKTVQVSMRGSFSYNTVENNPVAHYVIESVILKGAGDSQFYKTSGVCHIVGPLKDLLHVVNCQIVTEKDELILWRYSGNDQESEEEDQ